MDGDLLFTSITGTRSDQSTVCYNVAFQLFDSSHLISKTVFVVQVVQSHEILIGRGVSWRSLRRHDLQPLEFAIVVVRRIRDHLIEQHMDGGDDLFRYLKGLI